MEWLKVKAYAVASALTAEATTAEVKDGIYHTVSVEVAKGNTPDFDWANKLQVRLTQQELPMFLAVLLGWAPKMEGRHHGPMKDKGFELIHQGTNAFLKISQARKGIRVIPIAGPDMFALSGLITHQLLKNNPWLTSDALLTLLKNTIGRTAQYEPLKRSG